jgi:voltage-gated potassium channel Kch
MAAAIDPDAGALHALAKTYLCRRYTVLFYVLLLTLVAVPLTTTFGLTGALIEFLLAATLLAAVMPVDTAKSRRALLAAAALVWVARPLTAWFEHSLLSVMTLVLWTLMGFLAAVHALRFAMKATQVDAEHLYAALSSYLLAGIFFGLFYWVLEQIDPGTFSTSGEFSRMSALYFSFVTLATLGYGDIVPRTDLARGLAIVEGVGGQLFLAVMVARLVSLYAQGEPRTRL